MTVFFDFWRCLAKARSWGLSPAAASTTKRITSAFAMARFAWRFNPSSVAAFDVRSRPAVSMIVRVLFLQWQWPKLMSCVVPGTAEVIAFLLSRRRLNSVDFPTFVLPTMAIAGVARCRSSIKFWFTVLRTPRWLTAVEGALADDDDEVDARGVLVSQRGRHALALLRVQRGLQLFELGRFLSFGQVVDDGVGIA